MNKAVQIRIRAPTWDDVKQYISDYIDTAPRCLVFNHNIPDNNHYHVYLFDIDVKADSIRKKLSRYLPKQNYAVSITAGKEKLPITPSKAYQYGTTDKLIDPISHTGFEAREIQTMMESAKTYYDMFSKPKEPVSAVLVTREDHYVVRPDRTWEHLVNQIDKYKDKHIKHIKAMIAAEWINNGKAIPRPSDLHRYAVSIHYRLKYWNKDWEFTVPDWALETEYS